MKKVYLFFMCICTTLYISAQETDINWITDFEKAKQLSEETRKPILMYFNGSDWCGPCKMLKVDFFNTEEFKQRSQNLILIEVDIPRREDIITEEQRKANIKLLDIYNKDKAFPTLVALNHNGKLLATISAYSTLRDPSNYFGFVDTLLKTY